MKEVFNGPFYDQGMTIGRREREKQREKAGGEMKMERSEYVWCVSKKVVMVTFAGMAVLL